MANRPLRHSQALERAKSLLRIDHSDVYLTNERLDEELSFRFDSILYKRCRQRIAMDSEISELRKACRPKTSALARSRVTSSRAKPVPALSEVSRKANSPAAHGKARVSTATARLNSSNSSQVPGLSYKTQVELPKKGTQRCPNEKRAKDACDALQFQRDTEQHHRGMADTRVRGSKDEGNVGTSESSEDSDSICTDDLSDNSDAESSSSTNAFGGSCNKKKGEILLSDGQLSIKTAVNLALKENSTKVKFLEKKNSTKKLVETASGKSKNKSKVAKGKDELMVNLAFLKLDSVPFQWFTGVLQPRDSLLGRRPRPQTAKVPGRLDSSQRSNILPFQRNSQKTDKSCVKQPREGVDQLSHRPQTSLGFGRSKLTSSSSESMNDQQNDNEFTEESENDPINQPIQESSSQLTRSSSFFERSQPKVRGKSRRQLVEQAQSEAGDIDYFAEQQRNNLQKQQEENAAEQANLDVKVKDFVRSLQQVNKSCRKRDILECLVQGLPLD